MITTEILSRLQFAFTISFHILFPSLTIGLSFFLVFFEARWLKTRDFTYLALYQFWSRIFALSFGMGVVSGIVLSFELGTNFSKLSQITGNVLGPLLAYEVLSAFFLEAGFLGIMLFGLNRVGKKLHFFATCMVALGTAISAFWIISANSWMQMPSGYTFAEGSFFVKNWGDIIFSPTFILRFLHVVVASGLTASFVIISISAYYLLNSSHRKFGLTGLRISILCALCLAPTQIFLGDLHGLKTEEVQPIKVAAMEGRWETMRGAPLILFAIPDTQQQKNHLEISIPKGASLLLKHSLDGEVTGLQSVPPSDRPNVPVVFYCFRLMVLIGFLMLGMALWGGYLVWKKRLIQSRWFLRSALFCLPAGFIATLAGWYVAEVGRHPSTVQGLVRVHDIVSAVPPQAVMLSFILFIIVYNVLLFSYLFYASKLVKKGPLLTSTLPEESTLSEDALIALRTPHQGV